MMFSDSDDRSVGGIGGGNVDLVQTSVSCRRGAWTGTIESVVGGYVGEDGCDDVPRQTLTTRGTTPDDVWEGLMALLNESGWPKDVRSRSLRVLRRTYRSMDAAGISTEY